MAQDFSDEIPFHYFENDYAVVRVKINDTVEKNFILDTGIGVTLFSKSLCEQLHCVVNGEHVGKRMSGQAVHIPMSTAKSLAVGGKKRVNFPVGIFDIDRLMPGSNIDGFLSLGFFKEFPHTMDYQKKVIRFETEASLAKIRSTGTVEPLTLDQQGPAFGVFMPLTLPNGEKVIAEVDTGSQSLVLHERFMKAFGLSPTDSRVKRKEGTDETGHSYVRYFAKLPGPVHLPGAEKMSVEAPAVMFQNIIYDGLVGFYFLREFQVTYDLRKAEIIFSKPTSY
jgi:hypothetical protein